MAYFTQNLILPSDFSFNDGEVIDFVPARHAHWVLKHGIIDWCECSRCRAMISQSQLNRNYCPKCGAIMDEPMEEELGCHSVF